jgi:hypothetical protein
MARSGDSVERMPPPVINELAHSRDLASNYRVWATAQCLYIPYMSFCRRWTKCRLQLRKVAAKSMPSKQHREGHCEPRTCLRGHYWNSWTECIDSMPLFRALAHADHPLGIFPVEPARTRPVWENRARSDRGWNPRSLLPPALMKSSSIAFLGALHKDLWLLIVKASAFQGEFYGAYGRYLIREIKHRPHGPLGASAQAHEGNAIWDITQTGRVRTGQAGHQPRQQHSRACAS